MSSPDESGDLTPESSSPENTQVLTPSRTATKTKKCSYCWIEVQSRGHFQHQEACARKFAKKTSRRSSAGQSKVSTPISDEKKGNYRKCLHCNEMKHARSLKAHAEKCEKYRKFVKNGTDCGICSRSYESKGTTALYMHLGHSHKNELLEFAKEGSDQNETMEPNQSVEQNESMDRNDTLEQSEENITEGRVKKARCGSCADMIHVGSMKRHTMSCPTYQRLIRNGSECIVCSRKFESRKMLYSHIGKSHKAALVEIKKGSKQNKEQNKSRDQDESMDQNESTEQDLIIDENESTEQDLIIDENESMEQNDTVEEREDNIGKIKKNQCAYCLETYHKDSIKRHSNICGLYQKFVRNGSECSICMEKFESRKELNGHIGRRHKKELNEIIKSEGQTDSGASSSDNICKNCSESFTLAIELKQHEKICQSGVVGIEMTRTPTPKELSPRESFDKQTDFGHDEANTNIISCDSNPSGNDEAMQDTIEETLEEGGVVLDRLNNDTIKETLEENNVHNDSIVMNECKYCEDAIPNKRFKAHADQCKKATKYVNKRLNACLICEHKFSSKRDVFLHVQKKHLVNIGGDPNSNEFDEIDIADEEVEQNGIENQARMDQDGLSNVVISSGTSLQNQVNLINPRTTLNPNMVNPDMARMLVKRDPNALPLMELNPNFHRMRPPTEDIDSRIVTKLYMCPICLGKLVDPMHGGDHITRFHRIRYEDQMRLGLKLTEVPI